MSSSHDTGPGPDLLRGPLRALDARVKLVGLVVFLLAVGVTPNHRLGWLTGWLAASVVLATIAYVSWGAVLRRFALDVPVLALAGTQAIFGHGPHVGVGPLTLSRPGLVAGGALLLKATTGIVAVSAVAASTTVPEVLVGLRRLGLPSWFTELVGLSFRQVALIQEELARIRLAASLRRPDHPRRAAWSTAGRSLATQLVRATDRADRLQLAADLRGGPRAAAAGWAAPSRGDDG